MRRIDRQGWRVRRFEFSREWGDRGGRDRPGPAAAPASLGAARRREAAVRSGRLRERPGFGPLKKPNDCHRSILAVEQINGAEVQ